MPRKPPHRAPRARKEPTDIEKANAAGVQYAEDQLEGDYFTDWVRDQLLEASRMPEDKVLPLETKSDAMVIAKKMLRQLERDTKRDLSAHDIESLIGVSRTTPDSIDAFFDGFGASLELARDWLADELLEINNSLNDHRREMSERRPRSRHDANPLSGPRKNARDTAIKQAADAARRSGAQHSVWMSRRGEFQFGPSSDAPWKETIATVNPQGHVSHKRHGIEERHPSGVRESSRSAATTPPITRVVVRKLGNGWVTKVYDSEGHLRSGISAPSSLDYVKRKSEEWFPGVPVEYEEPAVPSTGKYRQGR